MPEIKKRIKSDKGIKTLDKGKNLRDKTKKPNFKETPKKVEKKESPTGTDPNSNAGNDTAGHTDEPRERVAHAPIGSMPEKGKEDDSSVVAYADSKLKDAEEKIYRTGKTTVKQVVGPKRIPYKKAPDPKVKGPTKPTVKKPNIKTKTKPNPKVKKPTTKTQIKPIKQSQKAVGRTAQATKQSVKEVQKAKRRADRAKKVAKATRETAKRTAQATKTMVQAIIAALKSLITAIISGGWIAVLVIVVICLIGALVGSVFGIFFSGEDTGTGMSTRTVVHEINTEYMNQIDGIKASTPHEKVEMVGSRAAWKDVLAVYAVRVSTDPENAQEVASMTEEKKTMLKEIFWDMHTVSHTTEVRAEIEYTESEGENGEIVVTERSVQRTYLIIQVAHKTADEAANQYGFTNEQKEQLNELLLPENQTMWNGVLYGLSGQGDLVAVAFSQLGNVGGEPYWSWYGFEERVDWCAIFVSWCANECGYLENGVLPSFAVCYVGEDWFKDRNQWQDNTYTPNPGDIIFFDWNYPEEGGQDGIPNHVGIVEKVENGIVYTIEGNSGDACREKTYSVGYYEIYGYGVLCS